MDFANQPLAELAIAIPMATEIFRKNRLDFCCGGKQTLKDACAKGNINLTVIIDELSSLVKTSPKLEERSLPELTRFIVERYHEDLRRRFPELLQLSTKVERVHSEHKTCPRGLSQLLQNFFQEMEMHMMKEENILFPLIQEGKGHMVFMPVKVMTSEHEAHGTFLANIRKLTKDFFPPLDACPTWRALYNGLEKLEEELMDHIHLENNILFPSALAQRSL